MSSKIDFPLIQLPIPTKQFVNVDTKKDQIFLHHTAGNGNPYGVVDWWNTTPEAVSTSFLVSRGSGKHRDGRAWKDGEIYQCFSSSKWGWHLGLKAKNIPAGSKSSTRLNSESIGIEICNWGYLTPKGEGLVTYAGTRLPDSDIIELDKPYRGYKFWQRYTDAQLDNTRKLLIFLCDRWGIDRTYKGDQMFEIDPRCFKGENGIWTHGSVRRDKWDVFPQPELIQMLKSL